MQKTRVTHSYRCDKCFWLRECKERVRDCTSHLEPRVGKRLFGTTSATKAMNMTKASAL